MPRAYLLIDGYNLMHAGGMARRTYGPGQLERCRARLLRYLATHLTPIERERTTIVFDAADAPPDLSRHSHFEQIAVSFASAGQEADDLIEDLIAAHSSPRQIRLVSSDHRLQRSVRRRRGRFVDSEVFVEELERRGPTPTGTAMKKSGAPRTKAEDAAPAIDTETWLRIFGEIPELSADQIVAERSLDQADVARMQAEIEAQDSVLQLKPPKRSRRKN